MENPEATRAENEPRAGRDLLVLILVVVIVIGTIAVTRLARRPRATRPAENSPEALGLPSLEVAAELQSVANRILAAWRRDGAPPTSLEGLPPDEDDPPADPDSPSRRDPPLDFWGGRYVLEREEAGGRVLLTLVSHGADGAPGGLGDAQDLLMDIEAPDDGEE